MLNTPSPSFAALALIAVSCGGTVAEERSSTPSPSDAGTEIEVTVTDTARTTGQVACGDRACNATQVCGAHPDGATECYERGSEPIAGESPWPWPTVLLYCDGDDDCAAGTRCVMAVGEIFRATCMPETDMCGMHAGHLCTTDADCHTCPNPGDPDRRYICRPQVVSGAKHLRACAPG